ncbi:MAG: PEP-CTERM sorting domain-containing protein [Nitrospirota bacterium]|jgi:hypothetical protein
MKKALTTGSKPIGKEVKIMKRSFIALLAAVMLLAFVPVAGADYITFDDPVAGPINVYSFDWNVGNALADGVLPEGDVPTSPDTQPFTLYYQATLGNFLDVNGDPITGTGLNDSYEITVIAAFGEVATSFGGPTANFFFDPTNETNYAQMYIDDINANNLAGTGFDDGTLLLDGTVIPEDATGSVFTSGNFSADLVDTNADTIPDSKNVAQFDQFNDDDYPGVGTVTGSGTTTVVVDVDETSVNGDFLSPTSPFLFFMELLTNTSQVDPFLQQDPSGQFWDEMASMFISPTFGDCSGGGIPCEPGHGFTLVNGSTTEGETVDFQFQADANSAVRLQVIPEPTTLVLFGSGLLLSGLALRRRR